MSFFHFFKISIFLVVSGVKEQKVAWNDKKLCLLCSISQELYIIWSSFVVDKCKMIICPGVFLIFSKFWFPGLLEGSRGKNGPKPCPLHFISQEPWIIWSWFMVHICERIISSGVFYIFPNCWYSGSISGEKEQKMA